jgi:hypothetical protein
MARAGRVCVFYCAPTNWRKTRYKTSKQNLLVICLTIVDGDIDLDSRFNRNTGDLLDNIRRGVQVDQALVDAHFEAVPGVGTLSTRSLTGGNSQVLGGETDGSSDMKLLVQRGLFQVGANLFQVLDITGSQGDADAVDNLVGGGRAGFFLRWEGHD